MRIHLPWLLVSLLLLSACKDPFEPPGSDTTTSFLVLEGYISGNGPTTIKLSRTTRLTEATSLQPELNAEVKVEGSNGTAFDLSDNGSGIYTISSLALNTGSQYRVHIKTAEGKVYASDYVDYKVTPPLGNLSWEKKPNGVQIIVNTQDADNETRYYRWDFEETWEFNSIRKSFFVWSESQQALVPRTNIEALYTCWRTEPSNRILLGSSAKLQQDIIANYPLTFVADTSEKLAIRYSILAKQYALPKEAFEYWQVMAKNTEQRGDIFDPQPTELKGNIRCLTNPNERVIGFISAGTVEEKRIFIDHQEIPDFIHRSTACNIGTISANDEIILKTFFVRGLLIPIDLRSTDDGPKYTYSTKECVDCRTKGTNIKPSFW